MRPGGRLCWVVPRTPGIHAEKPGASTRVGPEGKALASGRRPFLPPVARHPGSPVGAGKQWLAQQVRGARGGPGEEGWRGPTLGAPASRPRVHGMSFSRIFQKVPLHVR